jgi:phosphate transport system permease protein
MTGDRPEIMNLNAVASVKQSMHDIAPVILKLPRRPVLSVVGEKILETIIKLSGVSAIIFVIAIFFFVFREAVPVLFNGHFDLTQFLFSTKWYPTSEVNVRYGTLALTIGSFSVTVLAMIIAVPFGIGAAIYVSEFCGPRQKETLKIVIELLAAIPSVVWGFIGLTIMSKVIIFITGAPVGVNVLNGGIILALMSVPIIVSIGEDALKAVPDSFREASLAMGTTKWQTIRRVLLPAAKNGLLAAVLLGVGRAVGETMAVLMATGHAVRIPYGVLDSVRTLTANVAAELGEASAGSDHYRVLFLTGVLLFAITFTVNLTADFVIRGFRRK